MDPHGIAKLLTLWPDRGAETPGQAQRLSRIARTAGLQVHPSIPRDQLRRTVASMMQRRASMPWKYLKYLKPNVSLHQQAVKIQPGAMVPVTFNGFDTTMYVDTARRLNFRGKPWFVEMKVKINTEHMPIVLTNETKCDCVYCGTSPRGDEQTCRSCGAPLDC